MRGSDSWEALPVLSDPSYKTHDRASMVHWTKCLAHIRPSVKVWSLFPSLHFLHLCSCSNCAASPKWIWERGKQSKCTCRESKDWRSTPPGWFHDQDGVCICCHSKTHIQDSARHITGAREIQVKDKLMKWRNSRIIWKLDQMTYMLGALRKHRNEHPFSASLTPVHSSSLSLNGTSSELSLAPLVGITGSYCILFLSFITRNTTPFVYAIV